MKLKSLEITEEEKEALKTYCEYQYTYINLLTSGDMDTIKKMDVKDLKTFSKEYFEEGMDVLKKVYSAMCKYSYGSDDLRGLSRGTTVAEVESLKKKKEYTKLLSTSYNEESAKEHAGSKVINFGEVDSNDFKRALIRVSVEGNLPYINVNNVLGDESNHSRESEIILAPFGKFKSLEWISSWNDMEYYNATIETQELKPVENMEELKKEISDNIQDIPKLIEDYNNYKIKLENAQRWKNNSSNTREDNLAIQEQIQDCEDNMPKLQERFNSIRDKMVQYAKGMCCITREKVNKEVEQETKNTKTSMYKKHGEISKDLAESAVSLRKNIETIKKRSESYQEIAERLGLSWKQEVSARTLEVTSTNIRMQLDYMKQDFDIEFGDKSVDKMDKTLETYESKKNVVQDGMKKIEKYVDEYNDSNFSRQIKGDLSVKLERFNKRRRNEKIRFSKRNFK